VMARNEAAKMQADTVKPLGEPTDGSQPWGAYRCGSRVIAPASQPSSPNPQAPVAPANSGMQTFPVKGS